MINWIHILYIELLDRLGLGARIKIKYTMKCNLHCSYCSVNIPCGQRAEFEELTNEEWLQRIDQFPMKIRKIIMVGGEPFYRKDIAELVGGIVKRRIVVKILTNLTYKRIMELPRSPYLKLVATYHHGQMPIDYFRSQYARIKSKYRIVLYELREGKSFDLKIPGSKILKLSRNEEALGYKRRDFIIAPNGAYFMNLLTFYRLTGFQKKHEEEFK